MVWRAVPGKLRPEISIGYGGVIMSSRRLQEGIEADAISSSICRKPMAIAEIKEIRHRNAILAASYAGAKSVVFCQEIIINGNSDGRLDNRRM